LKLPIREGSENEALVEFLRSEVEASRVDLQSVKTKMSEESQRLNDELLNKFKETEQLKLANVILNGQVRQY
jgi:hypothetical protein